jgi:hypothetical protein
MDIRNMNHYTKCFTAMRGSLLGSFLLLLIIAAIPCGCAVISPEPTPTPTCKEQSAEYLVQLDNLINEWMDVSDSAIGASSASLVDPLSDLQRIERDVAALDAPPCAAELQQAAEALTGQAVVAFTAVRDEKGETVVSQEFTKFNDYLNLYLAARREVEASGE